MGLEEGVSGTVKEEHIEALEPVIEPDEETWTVVSSEWQGVVVAVKKKRRRFGVRLMAASEESSPSSAGSLSEAGDLKPLSTRLPALVSEV